MATLQSIRDRAGVLIAIIIGLAILAFVLGDFLGGQGSSRLGMKKKLEIGEISGKSISYLDFDKKVNNLTDIYKLSGQNIMDEATVTRIQQETWDQMVRDNVMSVQYKNLGLAVSSDEIFEMVQGENPHAFVRQIFSDPNTGYFDRGALIRFLKNMESDETGNQQAYWLFIENQIHDERMFTKYLSLVRKGLYISNQQVDNALAENSESVDFKYIIQRYANVADSSVTVSEEDIKKYYNENKDNYKQTASRSIEYVTFDVNPSNEDIIATEEWITDIKSEFDATSNIPQFVNANSESDFLFDFRFYKDGELPSIYNDLFFKEQPDTSYGPYLENETYKLARLVEIRSLSDSVHARHILISPGPQRTLQRAKEVADSLLGLINSGTDFALLATFNSDDQGSAQLGGDLGWFNEGAMVKPFNDACFFGNKGDKVVVESQFGFHIIEILDQGPKSKKAQVGVLARTIQPSSTTYQNVYSEASRFAGINNSYDKFIAAIEEEGLNKRVANDIKEADRQIPGLESPRLLIMSVFKTDKSKIVLDQGGQAVFELEDKNVIAYVTEVKEEGTAPLDQVREDVELNARKKKKAEALIKTLTTEIEAVENIEDLADNINTSILEASDIGFNSFSIPGAGIEPNVIGHVVSMEENTISQPIEGLNGVYVLEVTAKNQNTELTAENEKTSLTTKYQNRVNFETYNSLLKLANVKDKRSKFY